MPEPARIVNTRPRAVIDLRAAIAGALRTWLAMRDEVLMRFCGGADEGDRLPELHTNRLQEQFDRLNTIRQMVLEMASKAGEVEGHHAQLILTEVIDELLGAESPKFLLSLPGDSGTF